MPISLQIAFWLSLALLAYIYAGYPLLVWLAGIVRPTRLEREPWSRALSVVLVVHNEEGRIRRKLDSILRSDCADQICEILVGSDGSDDGTCAIVDSYPDDRVRLVEFSERRGKPACLNELIPDCRAEIVVLTDVRQELEPTAISRLAELFADVRTGAVSGELVFRHSGADSSAAQGIGAYWRYEKFIRRCESRFRSVPGATGALYAIRRNVFQSVPNCTILDDVAIPMQLVARGYHCAFEPGAVAYDEPSASPEQESVRKRRTIAGCAQLMREFPEWLSPRANPIWWEFVSHKILRLFSPLLLIVAAVTNALLVRFDPYFGLLAAQGVLYLAAALGWHYQRRGVGVRFTGVLLMFVALNVTTVSAWWDALRGRFNPAWQRAA